MSAQISTTVVSRKVVPAQEQGALARLAPSHVTRAAGLVQTGRVYDLGLERYRGMPLPPMHPPLELIGYRSPLGLRNEGDQGWIVADSNRAKMAFNSELVIMCLHTGTHLDSLAHITVGDDSHWFGGFRADRDLGDFGPLRADASTIRPIVARGVLLDVASAFGMKALPAHQAITADDLERTADIQGTPIEDCDVVLVRTGYLGLWPDRSQLDRHAGAGIDVGAARWLVSHGAILVGSDTEAVEQLPSSDPDNPHPVHSYLLIENGVLLLELADLELLAADGVHAFLFVGAPVKIRGATAGILDPIAVV
jgi:kynurenine formamidase